jgi:hypothetical protein
VVRWRGEKVAAHRALRAAIAGWCGSAWVRGGLVARSGSGSPAMHVPDYTVGAPDIVVVVDAASGRVHRMLAFRLEQRDGGCRDVLGWLDSATVLLASRGQGSTRVLVWDTSRDQAPHVAGVRRVTELPKNTTIALGQL